MGDYEKHYIKRCMKGRNEEVFITVITVKGMKGQTERGLITNTKMRGFLTLWQDEE